jgi:hypothetical protein
MMIGRSFFRILPLICFSIFLIIGSDRAVAADVSLAWDASLSPGITGYKVYVGTTSRTYGTPITIGNQTTYTITNLSAGTYYIAVTAYDASSNESGFSNEVTTTITGSTHVCDFNGDTVTNQLDQQVLVRAILGLIPSSLQYDLNSDSRVDALDLQILNNVISGQRSCP